MLLILSPTKTMKSVALPDGVKPTIPQFLDKALLLVDILKRKSALELSRLMKISPELARTNFERYQQWELPFTVKNASIALLSYRGEVFNGLKGESFNADDLNFAQKHLRILSGLYGVLRPFDLIRPYRLEMATPLAAAESKNLVQYWKNEITNSLVEALTAQNDDILIHLASYEYYKSIDTKKLNARVIVPVFKEARGEDFRIITVYAKKARGMMARFIIQNKLTHPDQLKLFDAEGYFFNSSLSNDRELVFTR